MHYQFYVDDMVVYVVSTNNGTQDVFDSAMSTLQIWFIGSKLQLTHKTNQKF